MQQIPIKLGPLALLLTVISICLTTLSILTFSTSSADMRLAQRYAETVRERYALEIQGQEFVAEASAQLAEGDTIWLSDMKRRADGSYEHVLEDGSMQLTIGFRAGRDSLRVTAWQLIRSWEEDDSINVWQGGDW